MKHNVNYFRLIENYFEGSITDTEKGMLFKQLKSDPLLKAEFDLQSDVITGLKSERKLQLKKSLDAIDIPAANTFSLSPIQAALTTISLLTISIFGLWWFAGQNDNLWAPVEVVENQLIENELTTNLERPAPVKPAIEKKSIANNQKPTVTAESTQSAPASTDFANATEPEAMIFTNENNYSFIDSELPESKLNQFDEANINIDGNIEVNITAAKGNSFQYRYFNNKLYLYGNFNDSPYEILEVMNKKKRMMYLFYKEKVYFLKENTTETADLQELTNQALIEELIYIKETR